MKSPRKFSGAEEISSAFWDPSCRLCEAEFSVLRSLFKVEESDFVAPWRDATMLKVVGSAGKGGAFFVKSTFSSLTMIKSLSKSECEALVNLCPAYLQHFQAHKNSLLVKVLGLFRASSGQHFIVLENVLPIKPVVVYDMKGSTIHRRAAEGSSTLLDKNWKEDNRFVLLNVATRDSIMDQISKDVQLLRAHNLMDYSLLVGVAEKQDIQDTTNLGPHCFLSGDGESLYELGIIDFLQVYNTKKKVTHAIKSVVHQGDQLSTVHPGLYADRFVEFAKHFVFDTVYDEDALM